MGSMKRSEAWKALERQVAKALKGERILRGADFSKKDVDVRVADFPGLQIDAKYRAKWHHHGFLADIIRKYCQNADDMPVLVTKHKNQLGAVVVMDLNHFGALLDAIRELRQQLNDQED